MFCPPSAVIPAVILTVRIYPLLSEPDAPTEQPAVVQTKPPSFVVFKYTEIKIVIKSNFTLLYTSLS